MTSPSSVLSSVRLTFALACLPWVACSSEPAADDDKPYAGSELERPPAPAADSVCVSSPRGVHTIERPMFPGRKRSPQFGYSYKVYPGLDPEAPTVIYVPGGPGSSAIEPERSVLQVPPDLTLIATDPRGVGCNAPPAPDYYPDEFYNSEYVADDILAIVEHRKVQNYIVYGVSYGTLPSTLVANRARAKGMTPPRAVVLEGVYGRAFDAKGPSSDDALREAWRSTLEGLPADVSEQFSKQPLPFEFSAEEWGRIIQQTLPLAALSNTEDQTYLQALLLYLEPGLDPALAETGKRQLTRLAQRSQDPFSARARHVLTCHELAENDVVALTLVDGELEPSELDCQDVTLDRAFSARDWPISVPIYYLSGTADTLTPPWQARFHFESQTKAPRALVHVQGAGHTPFAGNLTGDGTCLAPLWKAIETSTGFASAIALCGWPATVESATPQ